LTPVVMESAERDPVRTTFTAPCIDCTECRTESMSRSWRHTGLVRQPHKWAKRLACRRICGLAASANPATTLFACSENASSGTPCFLSSADTSSP
jgi:hypothetical protein